MKKGKFIVFGGLDQTGKTTQVGHISTYLEEQGIPFIRTREPGGTIVSDTIRGILLNSSFTITDKTNLLLFMAAREQHLEEVIRPTLAEGKSVICDRFFESSYIYQGAMGISNDLLLGIHQLIGQDHPAPDMMILFTGRVGNRFEQNILDEFCQKNRKVLTDRVHKLAQLNICPTRIIHVTGKTEREIFNEVLVQLLPILEKGQ